jgi:hypothetical protein
MCVQPAGNKIDMVLHKNSSPVFSGAISRAERFGKIDHPMPEV